VCGAYTEPRRGAKPGLKEGLVPGRLAFSSPKSRYLLPAGFLPESGRGGSDINASLDSLCEKQAGPSPAPSLRLDGPPPPVPSAPVVRSAPAHQLRYEAARQAKRQQETGRPLGAGHPKARLLSNKTHYSPTDPEARISVKPGKARALNYLCSLAVDTGHGVITHVQADFADSRDSLHLTSLVERLHTRLQRNNLSLRDLVADTGYSNGFNYAFFEKRGITPWIPTFAAYKPEVPGFTY
jgi:hypothetical protein